MIKSSSVRVDINYNTTAAELVRAISMVPAEATISVTKTKDYGPYDRGETYLTLSWTEEV